MSEHDSLRANWPYKIPIVVQYTCEQQSNLVKLKWKKSSIVGDEVRAFLDSGKLKLETVF